MKIGDFPFFSDGFFTPFNLIAVILKFIALPREKFVLRVKMS